MPPTMTVNVWDYDAFADVAAPRLTVPATLVFWPGGSLANQRAAASGFGTVASPYLIVAKGTDVRPPALQLAAAGSITNGDIIEAPAGTQRWYRAVQVEDVLKETPREYRVVIIIAVTLVGHVGNQMRWPIPMP